MKGKPLKPGDYIVFVLAIAFVVFLFFRYYASGSSGTRVEIVGISFHGEFALDQRRSIEVEGPLGRTRIEVGKGEVWISESPCKEKLCVKMGRIKREGEQIVCLPNRVVVGIKGNGGNIDGITR